MKKAELSLAALAARLLPAPVKYSLYKVKPLARLIRHTLNRAAPRGLTQVKVAAGSLAGAELFLDLQEEKDYWLGTYEPELQTAIRDFVKPGMVIYDVGANIGYISLMLARAASPGGRVFSFEALPENLKRLEQNIALNGFSEQITVVPAAVNDQPEEVHFLVHSSGSMGKAAGSAGRQEQQYRAEIIVPGVVLDDFTFTQGHPQPHIIKMDIEGGEVLAIKGMQRLLIDTHPQLLIELHGPEAAQTVGQTLVDAGYNLYRLSDGYPQVISIDQLDWKSYIMARR